MNFLSFFMFGIISIILISLTHGQDFNPLPNGNGKLNEKYNHKNKENNLFFLFFTFRHGARSPIRLIKNNTDRLGGKWLKKGELTNFGRKQHYEIGLKNRQRYSNFISNEYDPKEVKIFSTKFNRTINSVQSQLLGFYNNITYFNFSYSEFNNSSIENNNEDEINTIIPPIQLFELDGKKYQKTFKHHFDCKYLHKNILKNLNETNEIIESIVNKFNDEYHDILIKEYKSLKKVKISSVKGFDNFCDLYESIFVDENNKHLLNKISNHGKNITEIKEICDNYLYNHYIYVRNGGYASNNGIISQSHIFKKIKKWMQVRAEQNNNFAAEYSEPKFVLYSGHDSTVFEMQSFLKKAFNIDFEYVDFASTQLFELRQYNYIFYVEIYYNDKLKMNITFDEFKKRIDKTLMDDKKVHNICYRKKEDLYLDYTKIILAIIMITLFIVLFVLICKINHLKNEYANTMKDIQIQIE